MARIVLVAPGRGSYTRSELGYLGRFSDHPRCQERLDLAEQADALRRDKGEVSVSQLDQAGTFQPSRHLAGENASALIFACSAADAALIGPQHEVVAVLGNSMGWYSALYLSGMLSFAEAFRLVDGMGLHQRGRQRGGQILYPLVEEDWRPQPGRLEELIDLVCSVCDIGDVGKPSPPLASALDDPISLDSTWAGLSIHLGGYAVLGGTESGLKALEERLPTVTQGGRDFPFRLARHSAFHTPLMQPASRYALEELDDLQWNQPRAPAIDGGGTQWKPMQTLQEAVSHYTLIEQVLRPFDFTTAVRVAAREYNPDHFVLLGPGESLGGAVAQVLIAENWRGLNDRDSFQKAQQSDSPPLLSFSRVEQASLVV
ncbi:MAG TPA: ACP S-malonyltransferase [Acidobacteriota bacterium]|nr:ACP S-malonyltransferase [Acidobacteriota bacterium]